MLDHDQLVALMKQETRNAGSQKTLAMKWGISQQQLSDVLNRRRMPGPRILRMLGFEPVTMYKKIYRTGGNAGPEGERSTQEAKARPANDQ